ncbi:branched-chain amino acid aminotransferase [Streptomyces sp. SPB074]|uniref:branched-chain amino acid aminotransferase n=1 Tax=Streptomyces sp. (strain SPB074) TaxID=465543 RepID=UPI00017F15A8|nr:branched-chain amino acid aminotransferase [Streptomyces sp. SPB074]EDY43319.1 branched-chain-amino-acid transaminase [Streptomyces sp. SPB074]
MSLDFPLDRAAHPLPGAERRAILADPGFGRWFTDHMAVAAWDTERGWHDGGIRPLAPFTLHPGAAVLHYGQEIFEGLKAYRHADGSLWLFRPRDNARRFAASARRLALPELPEDAFLRAAEELVRADADWVPEADADGPEGSGEQSLYLRPFLIATEPFLGVRPSAQALFRVLASPAGPYFPSGVTGVTLWVTETYARAAAGGTGAAKCGGNYAGSLAAQNEAREHGCEQVLYLDSAGHGTIEESGTMNLCLVTRDGELLTPALGTILEGVTRDTVLALAPELGLRPVERAIPLAELRSRVAEGTVTEVFAAGTAAVLTPVTGFKGEGYAVTVGDGTPGATTLALRRAVLDLQYGRTEDRHGWLHRVR